MTTDQDRAALEMQKALEADGEKLRQLTGKDHGPFYIDEDRAARMAEIRERTENATPGPWTVDLNVLSIWCENPKGGERKLFDIRGWGFLTGGGHGALGLKAAEAKEIQRRDGLFAAHAREDIPWLLSRIEELEAQLAEAREEARKNAEAASGYRL